MTIFHEKNYHYYFLHVKKRRGDRGFFFEDRGFIFEDRSTSGGTHPWLEHTKKLVNSSHTGF